jgi:tRNA nucleotidyltransferase (CCA-adding enzyme)
VKTYLVGGAVRDQLLGLTVKERDWVVVGATIEEMIEKGFKPVGKDFPVFLHPKTHEEYALARTERKTAKGYKGFQFYTDVDVTLEQDLARRDITINAMARDESDKLIDLFGGQKDLKNKLLRHVSSAFGEDPVRILRMARFASKFGDFSIATETNQLMQSMVESGEVDALVPERVWQEFRRALHESYPERFIEVLRDCGALKVIFPEIDTLFGIPNPEDYHPEVDSGIHTLLALQQAVKLGGDAMVRFAVLMHDLGKIESPKEEWPRHFKHHQAGVGIVKAFCERLPVPKEYRDLAVLVTRYHGHCHNALKLNEKTVVKLLKTLDPFRKPDRFEQFLLACHADMLGRQGFEDRPYPQADFLRKAYEECGAIDVQKLIEGLDNPRAIEQVIHKARLEVVKQIIRQ